MDIRVLVVDDDQLTRAVLATLLDLEDLTVLTAADGLEAVEVARRERPDVVVLDVMMPRMDGYEACRTIKDDADLAGVPVILLTARSGAEDEQLGVDAGADAYLIKPFSPLKLIDVIRGLVAQRGG